MNTENVAANVLKRGVELDNSRRFTEALICYQEGLDILFNIMKGETGNKRTYLRSKIEEYMNRAELIKRTVAQLKEQGKYREQICIENNSSGYSYNTVFGRFLDASVKYVKVEDAYIRSFHQCQNFVRFCELCVKKCNNLKNIELVTTSDDKCIDQEKWLNELKVDLSRFNICLNISFSSTLHDRQIMLSTGWIIKIGRGLDYFKPPESKFSVGTFDLDIRLCHETTIDIFHSSDIKA